MSRSKPRLTSPVKRIFEWAGGDGKLTYYDREQNQRLSVELPFEFLVLDQLACVSGYSSKANSRIWSNEIRPEDLKTEQLVVRTKGELIYEGLYRKGLGGKEYGYASAVYIAFLNNESGEFEIGKLLIAGGAARGAWLDFRKGKNVEDGKIILKGRGDLETSGSTEYYRPVFEWTHADGQEDAIALRLDDIVQKYLETYFKAGRADREDELMVPTGTELHATTDDMPPPPDDSDFDDLLNSGVSHNINPEDLPFSPRKGE